MGSSWTRQQALQLISGAAGGIALHACTKAAQPSQTAADSTSAAVGIVTWIGYSPLYIAQEKGFFEELGLNLDVKVFSSGTDASAAFAAGQIDGLSLVPSEAVLLAANGADYRVVYVVDTSNGGDGILARNSIPDIAAFRDKKIAVEIGGVSHFFLLEVLSEAGLSEADVTLVNVTPDAAAAAYQSGNVEVAVTYAPFLFTAEQAQSDGRVIYDSSKLATPTAIADLFIFNTGAISDNSAAIAAFIQGNLKGLEFLTTNPNEGLAIAAEQLELTPQDLSEQLKGVKLANLNANIEMLNNSDSNLYVLKPMDDLANFLKNQEQIAQIPNLSDRLDPQFVLAIQEST
ncbi:ABC transporter substrate-binding protein [Leptolyngbya sp. FACHB-541]|uniref:ABC transporter substrate-binding protein n=1 Tax=Leptolyngbya sp. FACHB-541 TaxID=2692810 RepID=UPI001689531E|nr:ABC transporter substrate-binding protein [Leptolyngbya sp. FACHB-541]